MIAENARNRAGEGDRPTPGSSLGLTVSEVTGDLDRDLGHVDAVAQDVDAPSTEASELANAQAGVGANEDQCPVSSSDRVGQEVDLGRREEPHLYTLDARKLDTVARI